MARSRCSAISASSAWRALDRHLVLLLEQRLPLDLELDDAPLDLVDLERQAVDLDAQAARGLVHQVDRLVGQEAVADVAVGERGGGHQRVVGDPHAVVHLVLLLEPAEDGDGVGHAGLAHQHGLEAALQRRVLLDVLAVFVERRGTDDVELAPGERRLEHVARVHRALGGAGADDGVQLVDEGDVPAFALGQLLDHRLESLLELAAVLGAGQQLADVERHELPVPERLGHVAVDDALRQTLDDRRLAHAGLADQHGVVLGAPGEHLHDAADLLVPADDRIQLPLPGEVGEVPGVALERLELPLGRLVGHAVRSAHVLECRLQVVGGDVPAAQERAERGALLLGHREEQVLGGDVGVAQLLRVNVGAIENLLYLAAERRLGRPALLLRKAVDLAVDGLGQLADVEAELLEQGLHHTFGLGQQGGEQMGVVDDGIPPAAGEIAGVAEGFLGFDRQAIGSNHGLPLVRWASSSRAGGARDLVTRARAMPGQGPSLRSG